ncbi:MAG: hypothetical protein SGJ00_08825, partial [bacterium]|nr:hypothetical protein [bacterium]
MKLLAVNYHYFREEKYDAGIYPLSKKSLQKQIDDLAKEYTFISQSEISKLIQQQNFTSKNYCVITIDDGLKEQMDSFDFLKQLGVPCILYVPTFPIQFKKVLDVHKLHFVRTKMNDQELYDLLDEKYVINSFEFIQEALVNQ